jgi:hypothetical protein
VPVDRGNPGAASVNYGTGESEQHRRGSRDMDVLRNAHAEGQKDAAYNEGLAAEGRDLQHASMFRSRAIRRTGPTPGRR